MNSWKLGIITAALGVGLGAWLVDVSHGDSPLKVADGMKVTMEYTLTLADKTVVDTTDGKGPFSYVQGNGEIIPGLEKALAGMKAGDKKRVPVTAEQGYGPYDDKQKITVPKDKLPPDVKVGTMLRDQTGRPAKVLEVSDKSAVIDLNHPLAGKNLTFDVNILKVEKAPAAK